MSKMQQAPVSTTNRILICPYCRQKAVFVSSAEVYQGRYYGMIYLCRPCWAWVGVHKGTDKPLGRLANSELRDWKVRAHAALDPLWKEAENQSVARTKAYRWLAQKMGKSIDDTHIGFFGVEECKRVVEICNTQGRLP